ncbi:polysaccharide deacetylase family protein [Emticicia fluvialis]|uniref:polysaccharide deacetylase family protein n=1 Tax=Emticicia fluvialis TaxID=2974474 RepID=UPI002165A3AA|nr:polysaccharide deacetylase family protein [Emticicia fluvialis]
MKNLFTLFVLMFFTRANAQKQIAITIDDLPFVSEISLKHAHTSTDKLLQKIRKHNIQAVGFVNESMAVRIGEIDARVALLEKWLASGNLLGNHTFSHRSLTTTPLEDFKIDLLKGEIITTQLNKKYNHTKKYFRYPFLQMGADSAKRYGFEKVLKDQGYINAPVTIEADDWYYNKVYMDAMKAGKHELMKSIARQYIQHNIDYFDYYEKYTQEIIGRPIKHIFLCHANALNADYFDELCKVMTDRGYSFISLDEALEDEVYKHADTVLAKGGFSWLHRWKITEKKISFERSGDSRRHQSSV